jgi:hypothetical protein
VYFRVYLHEARAAAAAAGLAAPYFKPTERADDDLVRTYHWRSQHLTVPFTGVAGHWSVFLSYEFQVLSGERSMELVRTTFGLDAIGVPFAPDVRINVVRYDYDALLDPLPRVAEGPNLDVHINVLQPYPLADHIHIPGFRKDRWVAAEVLQWLTSPRLQADLGRRMSQQ